MTDVGTGAAAGGQAAVSRGRAPSTQPSHTTSSRAAVPQAPPACPPTPPTPTPHPTHTPTPPAIRPTGFRPSHWQQPERGWYTSYPNRTWPCCGGACRQAGAAATGVEQQPEQRHMRLGAWQGTGQTGRALGALRHSPLPPATHNRGTHGDAWHGRQVQHDRACRRGCREAGGRERWMPTGRRRRARRHPCANSERPGAQQSRAGESPGVAACRAAAHSQAGHRAARSLRWAAPQPTEGAGHRTGRRAGRRAPPAAAAGHPCRHQRRRGRRGTIRSGAGWDCRVAAGRRSGGEGAGRRHSLRRWGGVSPNGRRPWGRRLWSAHACATRARRQGSLSVR